MTETLFNRRAGWAFGNALTRKTNPINPANLPLVDKLMMLFGSKDMALAIVDFCTPRDDTGKVTGEPTLAALDGVELHRLIAHPGIGEARAAKIVGLLVIHEDLLKAA